MHRALAGEPRHAAGEQVWSERFAHALSCVRSLTTLDPLYIGGGNAPRLTVALPDDCSVVDNRAGIVGGIRLWNPGESNVAGSSGRPHRAGDEASPLSQAMPAGTPSSIID